jgi:hypothetical protein
MQRCGLSGLVKNWTTNFPGWTTGDFGWGGDRMENVLWRLQNGELDGMNKQATAEGTLNAMIETDAVTFYLGLSGNLYLGRKRQGVHSR